MGIQLKDIKKYENLEMIAKELVEGFITGLHRSPYHGFSVEFAEHKLYNYGESTKNIDWKVYAKTDRLYTKQYEEETNLRCTIVLDGSSSMYYPSDSRAKINFSAYAAAALSYLMISQRDSVGITTFDTQLRLTTAQKSTKTHLNQLLHELEGISQRDAPQGISTNIAENIHVIADKIHRRSLVILFTDMFEQRDEVNNIFEALQHLKHNKHEVLLFHVSDHQTERGFDFPDRPHRFVDLETNESVTITPNQIQTEYKKQMDSFYQEIKLGCGRLKIDFVEVNVQDSFDQILTSYLIKRKKMA